MQPQCPRCQADIPVENINVDRDVAVCQQCSELTSLSSLVSTAVPVSGAVPASFDIHNIPAGAWFDGDEETFQTGATTRSIPGLLFMGAFTAVWSGGSLGGIYGSQIAAGEFSLVMCLFSLPFLAGTIFMVSMCCMLLAGKVVVEVQHGRGIIFTGAFGIGRSCRFRWDEIDSVISDVDYSTKEKGQSAIALEGATRIKFGTMLSEARRYYIMNALRTLKARCNSRAG